MICLGATSVVINAMSGKNEEESIEVESSKESSCYHSRITSIPEKAPTCTEDGNTSGIKCADCGVLIQGMNVILALGHDVYKDVGIPVTDCINSGLTSGEHCLRCGQVLVAQQVIPPADHVYSENGVCRRCQQKGALLTFKVDEKSYYFNEGMTWENWVETEYNVDGFYYEDNTVYTKNGATIVLGYNPEEIESKSYTTTGGSATTPAV